MMVGEFTAALKYLRGKHSRSRSIHRMLQARPVTSATSLVSSTGISLPAINNALKVLPGGIRQQGDDIKRLRESSFDIRATSRLNRLYVELLKDNPEGGPRHAAPT